MTCRSPSHRPLRFPALCKKPAPIPNLPNEPADLCFASSAPSSRKTRDHPGTSGRSWRLPCLFGEMAHRHTIADYYTIEISL